MEANYVFEAAVVPMLNLSIHTLETKPFIYPHLEATTFGSQSEPMLCKWLSSLIDSGKFYKLKLNMLS
jgi:hypothetical protein